MYVDPVSKPPKNVEKIYQGVFSYNLSKLIKEALGTKTTFNKNKFSHFVILSFFVFLLTLDVGIGEKILLSNNS